MTPKEKQTSCQADEFSDIFQVFTAHEASLTFRSKGLTPERSQLTFDVENRRGITPEFLR
jgi:hypothetical protein